MKCCPDHSEEFEPGHSIESCAGGMCSEEGQQQLRDDEPREKDWFTEDHEHVHEVGSHGKLILRTTGDTFEADV